MAYCVGWFGTRGHEAFSRCSGMTAEHSTLESAPGLGTRYFDQFRHQFDSAKKFMNLKKTHVISIGWHVCASAYPTLTVHAIGTVS